MIENKMNVVKIVSPNMGLVVVLDNEAVADYFKNYTPGYGLNYFGKGELLPMNSVKFEWEAENAEYYEVYFADNTNFKGAEKYVRKTNNLDLTNLIPAKVYYWKVKAVCKNGGRKDSDIYNFKTSGHVRALAIGGVSNARDLGGAVTKDGKTIRYGLIFRSANGDSITGEGKEVIKKLSVKTDLDLRGGEIKQSPFGNEINLITINGAYYNGNETGVDGSEEYRNAFRDELKVCADPDNYPLLFHCAIGRDRTGTLAFVLQALCGVEKEALIREYELSYLTVGGATDGNRSLVEKITEFYNFIDSFDGKTFADKTASLVKSLGVTDAEVKSIKRILLG